MTRALILGGLGIVLLLLATLSSIRKQRRRAGTAAFARRFGFEHSPVDPFSLLWDYNFPLFEMGDGRGCENVVWGEWKGMPFRETDYWFYEEPSNRKGSVRTYRGFSAVVVDVPVYMPSVTVDRSDLLSRVTGAAGWHDLQFESEEFNRAFIVRAEEPAFAFKLIDARMMHWMLSTPGNFSFQFYGSAVLVWSKKLRPTELLPLIGTAKELCDHIPRLVRADYGTGPAPSTGTRP